MVSTRCVDAHPAGGDRNGHRAVRPAEFSNRKVPADQRHQARVARQHAAHQPADSLPAGLRGQLAEQQQTDSAALPVVGDLDGDLGLRDRADTRVDARVGSSHVPGDADRTPPVRLAHLGNERPVPLAVQIKQGPLHGRGQPRRAGVKAQIPTRGRKCFEHLAQRAAVERAHDARANPADRGQPPTALPLAPKRGEYRPLHGAASARTQKENSRVRRPRADGRLLPSDPGRRIRASAAPNSERDWRSGPAPSKNGMAPRRQSFFSERPEECWCQTVFAARRRVPINSATDAANAISHPTVIAVSAASGC